MRRMRECDSILLTPTWSTSVPVRSTLSWIFPQRCMLYEHCMPSYYPLCTKPRDHISHKVPKIMCSCAIPHRESQQCAVGDIALKGLLQLMEFKEGNEDLICYSVKPKSSREIQWCILLCWLKDQKGKKSLCCPEQIGLCFAWKSGNLWICRTCIYNSNCKKFRILDV